MEKMYIKNTKKTDFVVLFFSIIQHFEFSRRREIEVLLSQSEGVPPLYTWGLSKQNNFNSSSRILIGKIFSSLFSSFAYQPAPSFLFCFTFLFPFFYFEKNKCPLYKKTTITTTSQHRGGDTETSNLLFIFEKST